ncbi:MAG: PBP1A family penicillin-binding protein [Spirochaetales bacterium]|nr:PBP1A family penicillin-binding protein [Spirochaetales bacterium]
MSFPRRKKLVVDILLGIIFVLAVVFGVLLGLSLAVMHSVNLEELDPTKSALPTQIFDINGELISEFYTDERREIVSLDVIPDHLVHAILTREDQDFYSHPGFNIKRIISAAFHLMIGQYAGGGSTITQQVAKNRYCDRTEFTLSRKLVELWYAFQLERQYTKNEILEFYINEVPFGGGTNGVEAASLYYFGHSAREITLAESVILANLIAAPTKYSPFQNPDTARKRQQEILEQMVALGYTTEEEADKSYREYWASYDYTRAGGGMYEFRTDNAPWFSWYIFSQLEELGFNADAIYKGGLKVYTTLNLEYQELAREIMVRSIENVNKKYENVKNTRLQYGDKVFLPIIDLLSLTFNIRDIRTAGQKERQRAIQYYREHLNPLVDLMSTMFGDDDLKMCADSIHEKEKKIVKKTEVEGALVCIDSRTGHILAMVGGSSLSSRTNWFNRAVDAKVQPGSAFKPLYYSAAIEDGVLTPASMIVDAPVIFWNDDGTPYTPLNYKGRWYGRVLARYALAKSLNVPSLKVLSRVGFDRAIANASKMLGIKDKREIESNFPRKYPLGLGIAEVSPLQMARAYATFPNEGMAVEPIGIRFIEDRHGKKIREPEKELRARQKQGGNALRIMSQQTAYIMTDMMKSVVSYGTLAGQARKFKDRPIAGKTGTTQNWSDAWAVGFTPQITTSVWFGFDTPGNSLGVDLNGAAIAGPVWGEFMYRLHNNLPVEEFKKPETGLIEVEICAKSGLLPDLEGYCKNETRLELFKKGTEPKTYCDLHRTESERRAKIKSKLHDALYYDDPQEISMSEFEKSLAEDTEGETVSGVTPEPEDAESGNYIDYDEEDEVDIFQNNPLLDE